MPPPHLLPPELDDDEEENQELPDPAHRIWNPSPGSSPLHGIKLATTTSNP
jgi:hypothetical protein